MLNRSALAIAVVGFVLVCVSAVRAADVTPPTETKGFGQDRLEVVDISKDFPAMEGRQLRLRRLTVAPGGVAANHNHKDRPSITYVVSGEITDHREGEAPRKVAAGQSFLEPSSLTHWIENQGTDPAMLVAIDIFQKR